MRRLPYARWLPLAPRVAEEVVLCHGGAVGYWNGDVAALAADAAALRPTLFIGVPRVFETMMATVGSGGGGGAGWALTWADCVDRGPVYTLCGLRLLLEDRTGSQHGAVSLPRACARCSCG